MKAVLDFYMEIFCLYYRSQSPGMVASVHALCGQIYLIVKAGPNSGFDGMQITFDLGVEIRLGTSCSLTVKLVICTLTESVLHLIRGMRHAGLLIRHIVSIKCATRWTPFCLEMHLTKNEAGSQCTHVVCSEEIRQVTKCALKLVYVIQGDTQVIQQLGFIFLHFCVKCQTKFYIY